MRGTALLAALLLLPAAQAAERVEERLTLQLPSGTTLPVRLLRPASMVKPLPALILFGGLRRGAGAIDLVETERPLLLASFDYPVDFPRHPRWYQWPALVPRIRQGIADTRAGIRALYRQLRARADVDPQRIILAGVSLGAPFATLAAADEPIPAVILVHGFGELRLMTAHQFARRWERRYGAVGRGAAQGLATLLDHAVGLPDIETAARRLRPTQRVLLITAENDRFVPPAARESLWQALQASDAAVARIRQPGAHVRATEPERLHELVEESLGWLRREGLI